MHSVLLGPEGVLPDTYRCSSCKCHFGAAVPALLWTVGSASPRCSCMAGTLSKDGDGGDAIPPWRLCSWKAHCEKTALVAEVRYKARRVDVLVGSR